MADNNDDDSDHSDISETDHETLQTCSNKSNEHVFTNSSQNLTRSYASSFQSDVSVQNSTPIQGLDLKSHVENNDYSESNYKISDLSGHLNLGNFDKTSKSASDSVRLEVDKKDQPQSIEDIADSNVITDSEKDSYIGKYQ